jgi:hypothetical protein
MRASVAMHPKALYVPVMLMLVLLFVVLPFIEELATG